MQKNILLIGGGVGILVIIVIVVFVISKKQVTPPINSPTNVINSPPPVAVPTDPPNTDLKYAQSTDKSPDVGLPIPKENAATVVSSTTNVGIASSDINQSTTKAVEQSTTVGSSLDFLSNQVNNLVINATIYSSSPFKFFAIGSGACPMKVGLYSQ